MEAPIWPLISLSDLQELAGFLQDQAWNVSLPVCATGLTLLSDAQARSHLLPPLAVLVVFPPVTIISLHF